MTVAFRSGAHAQAVPAPINIDLRQRDSIDVATFLRGYHAAQRGEPFSEHQSDLWRDGYSFFAHMRAA